MPFKSEKQRRFMYSQHPQIAKRFEKETPKNADLPETVKPSKEHNSPPTETQEQIKAAMKAVHEEHLKRNGCL